MPSELAFGVDLLELLGPSLLLHQYAFCWKIPGSQLLQCFESRQTWAAGRLLRRGGRAAEEQRLHRCRQGGRSTGQHPSRDCCSVAPHRNAQPLTRNRKGHCQPAVTVDQWRVGVLLHTETLRRVCSTESSVAPLGRIPTSERPFGGNQRHSLTPCEVSFLDTRLLQLVLSQLKRCCQAELLWTPWQRWSKSKAGTTS